MSPKPTIPSTPNLNDKEGEELKKKNTKLKSKVTDLNKQLKDQEDDFQRLLKGLQKNLKDQ